MIRAIIPILIISAALPAQEDRKPITKSAEVDLLPLASGGWYGSLAAGRGSWRLRAVASEVHVPASFAPKGWEKERIRATAILVDHFFRPGFTGPWLGSGLERWEEHAILRGTSENVEIRSLQATFGGGWAFDLGHGFRLNPWMALHQRIAGEGRAFAGEQAFHPAPLQTEASVKIGYCWK